MEQKNLVPAEYGLQEDQAKTIESAFMPKIVERDALKQVYEGLLTQEITPTLCHEAKNIRLKLVKVRTGIAEIHKTQKAFFLAAGRFVDAWKNKETLPVTQMEERLLDIEEYYVRIEKKRIEDLQITRSAEIAKYQDEGAFIPGNLGELTDEVYANYLLGVKTAWEQKKAAEKAAKEAEEARIKAEKEEQERIRVENERLKKEAEEREAELKAEREKADAERKAAEEKEAALQAELQAKADAERKAAEEKEAALQAELAKGDAEKVQDLIKDLQNIKSKYEFKSKKNRDKFVGVCTLLDKVVTYIQEGSK